MPEDRKKMIENVNADMNVLRCPACSAPLTLKGKGDAAHCGYCNKAFVIKQNADGSILYIDKKAYDKSRRKQLFKWFVIISVIAVIVAAMIMMADNNGENGDKVGGKDSAKNEAHEKYLDKITTYTFDWPDNALGETVPEADFAHGWMYSDSSDNFSVDIGNVSKKEFEYYVKECTNAGFNVNPNNSGNYMHAFNDEGYELQVSYDSEDERMSISAYAPKEYEEYEWPDVGLATLLPAPKSQYGVIEVSDDRLKAEIYQTSKKDFEGYVDDCIKEGFDHNYDKSVSVGYFKGYDANGYELFISYEENDYNKTMTIVLE